MLMHSQKAVGKITTSDSIQEVIQQPIAPALSERKPEDSVYYHPVYNPFGHPPPGRPIMFHNTVGGASGTQNIFIPPPPPPPPKQKVIPLMGGTNGNIALLSFCLRVIVFYLLAALLRSAFTSP